MTTTPASSTVRSRERARASRRVPLGTPVSFLARDGFLLHGDLFEPDQAPRRAVLVAPAMAVPRGFYGEFARYLAQHGLAVLVSDYRGVGDSRPASLRGFEARLRDWSELDLEGALDLLAQRYPDASLAVVGHSIGGQLIGLLHSERIERVLLVAAQSGYHGHYPWPGRLRMLALWYGVIPGLTRACGYLPIGRITGSGVDIPAGVSADWTRWARNPEYVLVDGPLAPECCFESFRGPLLSYAISDDELAPTKSVRWLFERYRGPHGELRHVEPAHLGTRTIGHFAPFRPAFRDSLWEQFRGFVGA